MRADEAALMRSRINTESIDLSEVFARMRPVPRQRIAEMREKILKTTVFEGWQEEKLDKMSALQAVLELSLIHI